MKRFNNWWLLRLLVAYSEEANGNSVLKNLRHDYDCQKAQYLPNSFENLRTEDNASSKCNDLEITQTFRVCSPQLVWVFPSLSITFVRTCVLIAYPAAHSLRFMHITIMNEFAQTYRYVLFLCTPSGVGFVLHPVTIHYISNTYWAYIPQQCQDMSLPWLRRDLPIVH